MEKLQKTLYVAKTIQFVRNVDVFLKLGRVAEQIQGLEHAVKEIVKSKEKAMSMIENVSAVSEETAATTEEVYASTEEQFAEAGALSNLAADLQGMAKELDRSISMFKVD